MFLCMTLFFFFHVVLQFGSPTARSVLQRTAHLALCLQVATKTLFHMEVQTVTLALEFDPVHRSFVVKSQEHFYCREMPH